MSIAALRKMADLGLTLEQAIEVMEAMGAEPVRSSGAERQARYRARLAASGMTAKEWAEASKRILSRDQHECRYCASPAVCVDHVEPLNLGGSSADDNLVAACTPCNGGKSGRSLEEWRGLEWATAWHSNASHNASLNLVPLSPSPPPRTPPPRPHTREIYTPARKGPTKTEIDRGFAAFWAAYPRRKAKDTAAKAFAKAMNRITEDDPLAVILAGVERALPGWSEPDFIPYPATWLNSGSWEDEAPTIRTGTSNARPDPRTEARSVWADIIADSDGPRSGPAEPMRLAG